MREVKFRAWLKDHDVMVTVRGISWDSPEPYIIHDDISLPPSLTALEPNEPICTTPLTDCVLEQFTGIKDSAGVEIYEGDVVMEDISMPDAAFADNPNGVILFEDYSFRWKPEIGTTEDLRDLVENGRFGIRLGTIHDAEYAGLAK